jgi:hypothetical protein
MSKLAMIVPWALERATKKLAMLFASPFSPMAEVTAPIPCHWCKCNALMCRRACEL